MNEQNCFSCPSFKALSGIAANNLYRDCSEASALLRVENPGDPLSACPFVTAMADAALGPVLTTRLEEVYCNAAA